MTIEGVDWGYELRPQNVKFGNKLDEVIDAVNGVEGFFNPIVSPTQNGLIIGGSSANSFADFYCIKIEFPNESIGTGILGIQYGSSVFKQLCTSYPSNVIIKAVYIYLNQKVCIETIDRDNSINIERRTLAPNTLNILAFGSEGTTPVSETQNLFQSINITNPSNKITRFAVTQFNSTNILVNPERVIIYKPTDKLIQFAQML